MPRSPASEHIPIFTHCVLMNFDAFLFWITLSARNIRYQINAKSSDLSTNSLPPYMLAAQATHNSKIVAVHSTGHHWPWQNACPLGCRQPKRQVTQFIAPAEGPGASLDYDHYSADTRLHQQLQGARPTGHYFEVPFGTFSKQWLRSSEQCPALSK